MIIDLSHCEISFYDCPRPATCQDPPETAPFFSLRQGYEIVYFGKDREVNFWRIRDVRYENSITLAQGAPHDLLFDGMVIRRIVRGTRYKFELIEAFATS